MQDAGKDAQTFDQAGAWPAEVRVRVHCIDLAVADGRKIVPAGREILRTELRDGPIDVETARHQDNDFRARLDDPLPINAHRWAALLTQRVLTSGKAHHFGYPMAADPGWVQPLEADDARAAFDVRDSSRDHVDLAAQPLSQLSGAVPAVGNLADPTYRVDHLAEPRGFQR